MAAPGVFVVDIDPLVLIIILVVVAVAGYLGLKAWAKMNQKGPLQDSRGLIKQLFNFNRLPTVPTIRIVTRGDLVALELGKRARLRDNSLHDSQSSKGWDIKGAPIPIIDGKNIELGYVTHPAGVTVSLKPVIKQIRADEDGKPVYTMVPKVDENGNAVLDSQNNQVMTPMPEYIEANFEGVIGIDSDLDDFNESTERETSRGWIVPLLVGILAGVLFFAPLFAWLMGFAAGGK